MEEIQTYKQAIVKLEDILHQISLGQLDVDELAEKLKEAKRLVDFCQTKLKQVETDVNKFLEGQQ